MNIKVILKNHAKKCFVMLTAAIVIIMTITILVSLSRKYKIETLNITEPNGGKYFLQAVTLTNDFPNKDAMANINKLLLEQLIERYSKFEIDDEDPQKCDITSYMRQVEINNSWLSFRQDYAFSCETAVHPGYEVRDYNIDLNSGAIIDLNAEIENNVKNVREFKESIINKFINSISEIKSYFDGLSMTHILYLYHPSYLVKKDRLSIRLIGFCYAVQSYEEFEVDLTFKELCQYFKDGAHPVLSGFCNNR
jgi:hypothetical protein